MTMKKILELVAEGKAVTVGQLAAYLNVGKPAILSFLQEGAELGLLRLQFPTERVIITDEGYKYLEKVSHGED